MRPAPFLISLSVSLLLPTAAGSAFAQCLDTEEQKLIPSDARPSLGFGTSVAMSGDVAVAGATSGTGISNTTGAAYVFNHDGAQWTETQKVFASDGVAYDQFGSSVAMDGNLMLVGAQISNSAQGAAYLFSHDGTQWVERHKITASDGLAGDLFGDCAIDGNVMLIGAENHDSAGPDCGAAYVFRRSGNQVIEEQKLTASDAVSGEVFGTAVSISGNLAIVGAPGDADQVGSSYGAAYVFHYDGTQWNEVQKLTASDHHAYNQFGRGVHIDGNLIMVSATGETLVGGVYVFRYDGSQWVEDQKITASDAAINANFGASVATSDSTILIGTEGLVGAGDAAYVFVHDGNEYLEQQKLTASDGGGSDRFGSTVAMSGDHMIIGAFVNDAITGAIYAYTVQDLALDAAGAYLAGDSVALTTCGGEPGGLNLLVLVELNAAPMFMSLVLGAFDAAGQHQLAGVVPPGLAGITAGFQSFGFNYGGVAVASNVGVVEFL